MTAGRVRRYSTCSEPKVAPPKVAIETKAALMGSRRARKAGEKRAVAHVKREALAPKTAVHVTLTMCKRVPSLRTRKKYALVKRAFAQGGVGTSAANPFGFRLIHYAVLGDHIHALCEADSAAALARGIQKISISLARLINTEGVREAGGSLNPRAGAFRDRKAHSICGSFEASGQKAGTCVLSVS